MLPACIKKKHRLEVVHVRRERGSTPAGHPRTERSCDPSALRADQPHIRRAAAAQRCKTLLRHHPLICGDDLWRSCLYQWVVAAERHMRQARTLEPSRKVLCCLAPLRYENVRLSVDQTYGRLIKVYPQQGFAWRRVALEVSGPLSRNKSLRSAMARATANPSNPMCMYTDMV